MKIKFRYEEAFQTLEVSLEEMWSMLQLEGGEGMSVQAREKLVQAAVDEQFNRPEYNNLQKFKRHCSVGLKPGGLNRKPGIISQFCTNPDLEQDRIELYPDIDWEKPFSAPLDSEDLSQMLNRILPAAQASLLLRVHVDGAHLTEIAAEEGISTSAVCQRLHKAEKNFRKVFPDHLIFLSSRD